MSLKALDEIDKIYMLLHRSVVLQTIGFAGELAAERIARTDSRACRSSWSCSPRRRSADLGSERQSLPIPQIPIRILEWPCYSCNNSRSHCKHSSSQDPTHIFHESTRTELVLNDTTGAAATSVFDQTTLFCNWCCRYIRPFFIVSTKPPNCLLSDAN